MNLFKDAIKDHDFVYVDTTASGIYFVYKCRRCNIHLFYANKQINLSALVCPHDNATLKNLLREQNFYYYFPFKSSWDDVINLNSLSCAELRIKDIIE